MAASRVFVRGLPPSLTEEEFRKHFARGTDVTDIQLKPHRRIGYVGFKTPEAASTAVKYFHKSFIRMSRLHVELAQDVSQVQKAARTPASRFKVTTSTVQRTQTQSLPNSLKRKCVDTEAEFEHKKDGTSAARPSIDAAAGAKMNRTNTSRERGPEEACRESVSADDKSEGKHQESIVNEQTQAGEPITVADSDAEWIRNRTTRLLGLVDEGSENEDGLKGHMHNQGDGDAEDKGKTQSRTINATKDEAPHAFTVGDTHSSREVGHTDDLPTIHNVRDPTVLNGRLFIRNLAYTTTEQELRGLFESIGQLNEVQLPLDFDSGASKGFAFVTYDSPTCANEALKRLDGTSFLGRLLHILPASERRDLRLDQVAIAEMPLKKRKLVEKKSRSSANSFNWNSMYMNADAVVTSAAARLGISKSELFDPTSADAAVKQAQIETNTIQEAKAYFQANGVKLDSLNRGSRDGQCLLVKNFKYDVSANELKTLFSEGGDVKRVLMPPSGTIAIVEFSNKVQAKTALTKFAYRKHRDSVLFLERAPSNIYGTQEVDGLPSESKASGSGTGVTGPETGRAADESISLPENEPVTSTLFVRNLNFATTSERLHEVFKPLEGLLSARVKTRADPKHEGKTLSMGFGFLEFQTTGQARAAFLAMNGYLLEGHELQIKASHKALDAAAERRREDNAKRHKQRKSRIIIKNLPFEASKKDVRKLFGSYGQVKAVRLPKSSGNNSRGYAFADFTNPQQAERAMELGKTHLLGRKLVLEYAAGDIADPEKEIEKMQEKISRQSDSIALRRIATNGRKKFSSGDGKED